MTTLQNAKLAGANFQEVDLYSADLSEAYFRSANLSYANLRRTKLSGTVFTGVNFIGANLTKAELNHNKWRYLNGTNAAILPDGQIWTPDTEMGEFTHPDHPEFGVTLKKSMPSTLKWASHRYTKTFSSNFSCLMAISILLFDSGEGDSASGVSSADIHFSFPHHPRKGSKRAVFKIRA